MKKIVSFFTAISVALCGIYFFNVYKGEKISLAADAELLYSKIHEFLDDNESCSSEDFENVCVQYIRNNSAPLEVLDREEFDNQLENKKVLYRGVCKEIYADDIKQGNIYIGESIDNLRGNGMYTTTNIDCANYFAGDNGEIVTMILDDEANVLEYPYLQKLLELIYMNHPEEFEAINNSSKDELVFDSVKEWEKLFLSNHFQNDYSKMRESSELKTVQENRKYYFKDKEAAILHNSGLLAKLMGYDVLHTDEIDEQSGCDIQEHLILDAKVLKVCNS